MSSRVEQPGGALPDDEQWMELAVSLAWMCPPSAEAFSVGAVLIGGDGGVLARGYSRQGEDPHVHAEEAALGEVSPGDPRLAGATLFSTLEPCARRKSRPRSCAELILATRDAGRAGIARVVFAWREPELFVARGQGAGRLAAAGVTVSELPGFAAQAQGPNQHLVA
ncbi:MAG TPA: dCMP deaminase [Trebonia sp.]|jgi:5-amino-6-(5-phosphoribosylamino)uracil reductase|nr:dCMP deaminase [Trebonia sp.]